MPKSNKSPSAGQAEPVVVKELDKVTEAYIAEIRERGLTHVLEWASQWYARAARAEVEDMLTHYVAAKTNVAEKEELFLLDRLMNSATSADNFSTSPGHNLMKLARIAALSSAVNDAYRDTPASSRGRRKREEAAYPADEAAKSQA